MDEGRRSARVQFGYIGADGHFHQTSKKTIPWKQARTLIATPNWTTFNQEEESKWPDKGEYLCKFAKVRKRVLIWRGEDWNAWFYPGTFTTCSPPVTEYMPIPKG